MAATSKNGAAARTRPVGTMRTAVAGIPAVSTTYEYDGEGRRVKKTIAGVGTPAVMVYDAMGQAAVEVGGAASVAAATTAGPHYLMADGLGSVRLRTDGAGAADKCNDYLPFGEALVSGRPAACYGQVTAPAAATVAAGDWQRWQFTGQARDWETELDYFGARMYGPVLGRFTSPDEPLADQHAGDPQSWNLYSYVRNNPLIFTDPTGNDCVYVSSAGNGIDSINNQNTAEDCRKTDGYWVDGTVTQARFAHGSLILTGTTDGTSRTSASYGLGPDPGLMALQEAGNRAIRDLSTSAIIMGGTAAAIAGTYAIPAVVSGIAAMDEIGAIGPGVALLKQATERGSQLVKQFKLEGIGQAAGRSGGHGTPFLRAGAELIRQANNLAKDDPMRAALKQAGERLIQKGKSINH